MSTKAQSLNFIIFFVSTLLSTTLLAGHALPEFSANYAIQKYGSKLAEAHYQLSYTDTGYKFTQNTELYGLASIFGDDAVSAVSYVDEIRGNLLLRKHRYNLTGSKKNKDEKIDIQWNTYKNSLNGKITGTVRNKKINLKTDREIWEALSFQIPLMIEANENIKEYPYNAILKGKVNTYNFILTSTKKMGFAGKKYQALQLIRKDSKKKRELHIWLVPKLYNIPIVIENYRKGSLHSRMQLEDVQFSNDKKLIEKLVENETENNDDF